MSMKRTVWWTVSLLLLTVTACKKEEKAKVDTAPVVAAAPSFKVDESLANQIRDLAKTCSVDTQRALVSCADGKKETLVGEFLTNKRSRSAALETFVVLLQEQDEKLLTTTASILYDVTRANLGEKVEPASVSPAVAAALREQLIKQANLRGRLLAPAAAFSSALIGQLDELDQAVKGNTELEASVYRYTMVYGGLDAFKKIQELVKDERSSVRLAALEAPKNMRDWSPKDRLAICPWAEGLLSDKRPMVGTRAAALLSRCAGGSIDALLSYGEAALKSGEFGRGMLPAYRDLCSGMRRRSGGGATKEQCLRDRKLLESVVGEKKIEVPARALALSAIAYQWPDAEALKLAKKYTSAHEPELSHGAAQTVQLLERRQAAESGAISGEKGSIRSAQPQGPLPLPPGSPAPPPSSQP